MNEFNFPEYISEEYEMLSHIKSNKNTGSYIVYDKVCQRKVLLKTGKTEFLENEARILSKFSGKGIPQIYGCFERDGKSYLLRQYIEGSSLREYIASNGILIESEIINIGIDLCDTLSRFHEAEPPVIHRDIKTDNIIISPDGQVYIIDFGISREYNDSASRDTCVMGTISSAPPEQFGYGQTDERSDVYSIGVMLKEMAEGQESENRKKISSGLAAVINKCTEFSPENRCRNAGEIKKALLSLQKRRPRRFVFAVSAACICAAVFCLSWFIMSRDQSESIAADNKDTVYYSRSETKTEDTSDSVVQDTIYYEFADSTIEKAVCRILGKEQGKITEEDLVLITEIKLIGNTAVDNWDDILIHGETISADGRNITEFGTISSLEDLAHMPELETVILCNQEIWDISPLDGLSIKRLALHGNNIADLSPLKGCPLLEQLYISSNPIVDLSPLSELKRLYSINIGATFITSLDSIAEMQVLRNLEMCDCKYLSDYSALGESKNLSRLIIRPAPREAMEEIKKMTSLESLFIWYMDGENDLSGFSELKNLSNLFLDWCGLASVDGIEELPRLVNFYVRNNSIEDLSPVSQSKGINYLAVTGNPIKDWSFLSDLDMLDHIDCDESQYPEIIRELDSRAETVNITIE